MGKTGKTEIPVSRDFKHVLNYQRVIRLRRTSQSMLFFSYRLEVGGLIFEARSPPAVFAAGDNAFVEVHGWIRPQQGAAEPGWLMSLNLFLVFKICLDKSKWPNRSYWLVLVWYPAIHLGLIEFPHSSTSNLARDEDFLPSQAQRITFDQSSPNGWKLELVIPWSQGCPKSQGWQSMRYPLVN